MQIKPAPLCRNTDLFHCPTHTTNTIESAVYIGLSNSEVDILFQSAHGQLSMWGMQVWDLEVPHFTAAF